MTSISLPRGSGALTPWSLPNYHPTCASSSWFLRRTSQRSSILLLWRSLLAQSCLPASPMSWPLLPIRDGRWSVAAGFTAVPRDRAEALSTAISGYLLCVSTFAWSLLIRGTLSILYDMNLLTMFRHMTPPGD